MSTAPAWPAPPPAYHDSDWAEFPLEGLSLALHRANADTMPPLHQYPHGPTVIFVTEDIDAMRQRLLDQGVDVDALQVVAEYGDTLGVGADFRDPDGNLLALFTRMTRDEWARLQA
ncbi:MAG: hypothetical protein IGS03_15895 [Candidatus Sericytochromatia bacterium]|nr:hypothetical protein [Candidatus Sericytochromatia bacterium]